MTGAKIAGALLVMVACLGGGQAFLQRYRQRCRALEQLRQLLGRLYDAVCYQNRSADELLDTLRAEVGFDLLNLSACQHLDELALPAALSGTDQDLFAPCLTALGQADGSQLCTLLKRYETLCGERLAEARTRLLAASKLCVPLSGCVGAALVVLLL